ncbi:MAG: lytic polysaccharide monooxygenase [Deltaproteobacteria bacterium]|nr:lytic polysaccharide monooxygenase [Deltaproteobacteria bacterium]
MVRSSTLSWLVLLSSVLLWPATSWAHLGLTTPPSRYGRSTLKVGPCGRAGGVRSTNVTTFRPGEVITVQWDEYVDHPGHFRVAFDVDGDDDFKDPTCTAGCTTTFPTFQFYTDPTILLDNIPDTQGGASSVQVTLPNVECDNCTLQVIQVMYDKPPYESPGNDVYYQCADLVLRTIGGTDGGMLLDATTMDAGTIDSGGVVDAGSAIDGGSIPSMDGGADAAVIRDAGTDVDAGVVGAAGDDAVHGGCVCVGLRAGSATSLGWGAVAVFLLSLGGRHRHEFRLRQRDPSRRRVFTPPAGV